MKRDGFHPFTLHYVVNVGTYLLHIFKTHFFELWISLTTYLKGWIIEVRAWTVVEDCEGEGASTTNGSPVSTSSHRQWRWSNRGSRVGNRSGRGDVPPPPLTVTVSLEQSVCLEDSAGIYSSITLPSIGRVKCCP